MVILAITVRWNRLRLKAALWLRDSVLIPLIRRVHASIPKSDKVVNDLASRARLRMEVCKTCPFFTARKTCSECGCFMPIKTQMLGASCPKGKW